MRKTSRGTTAGALALALACAIPATTTVGAPEAAAETTTVGGEQRLTATSPWKRTGGGPHALSTTSNSLRTGKGPKVKPTASPSPSPSSSPSPTTAQPEADPVSPAPTEPSPAPEVVEGLPFTASSAWNSRIPAAPVLDPRSSDMVSYLTGTAHPGIANLYAYGVPIWEADSSTPQYTVDCVKPWGTCGLEKQPVPVPDGAFATNVDADGAMVVVDWSAGKAYEFYEGQRTSSGGWQAGWGGVVDVHGDGTDGAATGSNVSRLAGVVRAKEIAAGRIDHALVFSTNNACTTTFRYPAMKTDGRSTRPDCLPEGTRLFLDPSIDVDALPGITPGERAVAKALQTYGAYAIDNGGANMAFIFEVPSGEADPYKAAGFTGDYFGMDRIPWQHLRVLRQWDGG